MTEGCSEHEGRPPPRPGPTVAKARHREDDHAQDGERTPLEEMVVVGPVEGGTHREGREERDEEQGPRRCGVAAGPFPRRVALTRQGPDQEQ